MECAEEIVGVPIISALVYIAMLIYKNIINGKESFVRIIPSLTILIGCILGGLIYFIAPELMPASNIFTAILVGAGSGLAATGSHQIYKQMNKTDTLLDVAKEVVDMKEQNYKEVEQTKDSDHKNDLK